LVSPWKLFLAAPLRIRATNRPHDISRLPFEGGYCGMSLQPHRVQTIASRRTNSLQSGHRTWVSGVGSGARLRGGTRLMKPPVNRMTPPINGTANKLFLRNSSPNDEGQGHRFGSNQNKLMTPNRMHAEPASSKYVAFMKRSSYSRTSNQP